MPRKTDANAANDVEDDAIDKEISNASCYWKKQSSAHVRNLIVAKSQNKLKRLINMKCSIRIV